MVKTGPPPDWIKQGGAGWGHIGEKVGPMHKFQL